MAAQPYTVRSSRVGPSGMKELIASLISVTALDTVDFASDFARVIGVSVLGDSRNAPALTAIAANQIAGTVLTLPNALAWAKDDADLIVVGPSISA